MAPRPPPSHSVGMLVMCTPTAEAGPGWRLHLLLILLAASDSGRLRKKRFQYYRLRMLHAAAAQHAARLKHSSLEHKLPMMLHPPALEHAASTKKVVDFVHAEFGKVRQLPSAVRRVSFKTYQTSKRQTIQTRYLTATVRLSKHASMRFFTTSVSETSRQASIRPATRHPTIGYLTPSYIPYLTTNFHHIHPSPMSHFLLLL